VTVEAADAVGVQLVMPGQTPVPGSGDYPNGGITGSPLPRTAGETFEVTVRLVDRYMNTVVLEPMPRVYVQSNDLYDVEPDTAPVTPESGPGP